MTARDPQPGQRPPAPGQLAVLQAFLNTHFDLGANWGGEVLSNPAAAGAWLAEHGLLGGAGDAAVPEVGLRQVLALRDGLRAVIELPQDAAARSRLNELLSAAPASVRFSVEGPRFEPGREAGLAGALGALGAIAAVAMLDGSWSRLKLCPGHHCGWAFYDQSRNRSGRWCSMSVCGARTKARTHYARYRERRGGP